jgi:hypothetical protein
MVVLTSTVLPATSRTTVVFSSVTSLLPLLGGRRGCRPDRGGAGSPDRSALPCGGLTPARHHRAAAHLDYRGGVQPAPNVGMHLNYIPAHSPPKTPADAADLKRRRSVHCRASGRPRASGVGAPIAHPASTPNSHGPVLSPATPSIPQMSASEQNREGYRLCRVTLRGSGDEGAINLAVRPTCHADSSRGALRHDSDDSGHHDRPLCRVRWDPADRVDVPGVRRTRQSELGARPSTKCVTCGTRYVGAQPLPARVRGRDSREGRREDQMAARHSDAAMPRVRWSAVQTTDIRGPSPRAGA